MSLLLHFVRHAPVIGQDGIAYGRDAAIDTSCTTLFAKAAASLPEHCRLWVTSAFPRTQETAKNLQKFTGTRHTLEIYPAFNEQDFGDLAGRRKRDIIADTACRAYLEDMITIAPPGGESVPAMVARVSTGLRDLARYMHAFSHDEAVIVCHGGVIRSVESIHTRRPFDLHMQVPHLSVHSYNFDL